MNVQFYVIKLQYLQIQWEKVVLLKNPISDWVSGVLGFSKVPLFFSSDRENLIQGVKIGKKPVL